MSIDKCRESFEAEYRGVCDLERRGSGYLKPGTNGKWICWQAAWTASREEAAKEQEQRERDAEALIADQCDSSGVPFIFSTWNDETGRR